MIDPQLKRIRDTREKLGTLCGKARRTAYLALRAQENEDRRQMRRLPSPHAAVIAEMKRVHLLPPRATSGLTEAEHRQIRNKLKATRRKWRAGRGASDE